MNKKNAAKMVTFCSSSSLVCSMISSLLIISIVIIYIFTSGNNSSSNNYNQNYCIIGEDTNGYNIQNPNGQTISGLGNVSCSDNHIGTASVICNSEDEYFQFGGCYCPDCGDTGNPCNYYVRDDNCSCILVNKANGEPCDDNKSDTTDEFCDGNGVCIGRCPADHYQTYQGCIRCPTGQERSYSMTDSYCQDIKCAVNQEVDYHHTASGRTDNLVCKDCPPGKTTNGQEYLVKNGKQECINIECGEDEYVTLEHQCQACPPGTVTIAGDDASGGTTECNPVICNNRQRVKKVSRNGQDHFICEDCQLDYISSNGETSTADLEETECYDPCKLSCSPIIDSTRLCESGTNKNSCESIFANEELGQPSCLGVDANDNEFCSQRMGTPGYSDNRRNCLGYADEEDLNEDVIVTGSCEPKSDQVQQDVDACNAVENLDNSNECNSVITAATSGSPEDQRIQACQYTGPGEDKRCEFTPGYEIACKYTYFDNINGPDLNCSNNEWYVGDRDKSCDYVCQQENLECNKDENWDIYSANIIQNILNHIGYTNIPSYNEDSSLYGRMINPSISRNNLLYYNSSEFSTYEPPDPNQRCSKRSNVQRICNCK